MDGIDDPKKIRHAYVTFDTVKKIRVPVDEYAFIPGFKLILLIITLVTPTVTGLVFGVMPADLFLGLLQE